MADAVDGGLKIVDAFDLDDELRSLLRPGEMIKDRDGKRHRLPRYFYEIPSHEAAKATQLTSQFAINELLLVDLKEAPRLQEFPRYIPCAVRILAFYLQRFREEVGASIHVAVNGGYRSPAHKMAILATPHMWGTAADLYKIGTTILRTQEAIEKFSKLGEELSDDLYLMSYGHEMGEADDHIHVDLGYLTLIPREVSEDRMEVPQQQPRFAFEDRRGRERRTPVPGAPDEQQP